MISSNDWIDPRTMLPGHFEIVSVRLRVSPITIFSGYYCGLGVWFSPELCGTVITDDILEWRHLA